MAFSLEKTWLNLYAEEALLKHWEKRNRICGRVIGIFFVAAAWIGAFVTHFSYVAYFSEDKSAFPFRILWQLLGEVYAKGPDEGLLMCAMGSMFVLLLGTTILAVALRVMVRKTPPKEDIPKDSTKSIHTAMQRARELENRWAAKGKSLDWMVILAVTGVVVLLGVSVLLCMGGTATGSDMGNNLFVGVAYVAVCFALAPSLKKWLRCPIPKESQATKLANEIQSQLKKEAAAEKKQKQAAERQEKLERGIRLFLDGERKEAAKLLKNFSDNTCGDVAAIEVLAGEVGESVEAVRQAYDRLWKAKDLGFYNAEIRKAVDEALGVVTPVVDAAAQEDMLKIMQNFLNGHYGSLQMNCQPHIAYGYPDAIVLDIVTRVQSDVLNNPKYYGEWLEKMKLAKRRGLSDFAKDITDELITKLENAIRYNAEAEERKRTEKTETSFSPSFYRTGPLSEWAEESGWTDFRTGDPLYRVDGNIVNAKGEIVSPAWWD